LLTWQSFNVGKSTTLTFDQSAGGGDVNTWIAFNKVVDPTGVPSQILGSIQAAGQVYVLNQNGIIFGGSSQVNVHTLVASSLPLNDNLVTRGLLDNPDQQFLFSTLPLDAGANGTPNFAPPAALTADGKSGDVTVQAGAQLTSPASAEHVGGRIALFGANVTNAGTIATPDGQTILAAGQQVGLAAHDSNDPTLRGLDVFVGQGGGTVTNAASALIDAPRASVTLVGKDLNQLGAIASTTSVTFNGRVDLLASYNAVSSRGFSGLAPFFPQATGTITLGANSVTQVVPELASSDRVVGSQLALSSQLNLEGVAVYLAPKSILLAPGAALNVRAGNWNLTGTGATAQDYFAFTGGQIYLDAGATIDVSGSANVAASVTENIVSVQLRGSELADSPLQRDGPLRGQTVQVDIRQTGTYNGQTWVGTPLANTSGYVALVDHTVGELTTNGGSVSLQAGSSVVLQPGSSVNVSGGWINYAGGNVATTKLLAGGRVLDISQATPDRVYDGIYTGSTTTNDAKWGAANTSTNPQLAADYELGYLQGGNGGKLAIVAPAMTLDGGLSGGTIAGPHQRTVAPATSALSLTFQSQDASLPQNLYPVYSPTPPAITFQANASVTPVGAFSAGGTALPDVRKKNVALSASLLGRDGFGSLTIDNCDGNISVSAGISLALVPGGALNFTAANVDVQGKISAPGGSLSFTALDRSPYADRALTGGAVPPAPQIDAARGKFTLGSSASLSTAGLFVDDRPDSPTALTLPILTKGGAISIAGFSADLASGSVVDASGGVALGSSGKATYGNGGSIALKVGQDPKFTSLIGGQLNLRAGLSAFSGAKGGSLSLLAPSVQIGGTAANANTLQLAPEFFSRGGFANFSVQRPRRADRAGRPIVPGVVVTPGTTIAPVVQSRLLASDASGGALTTTVQPVGVRAPVSLSFSAPGSARSLQRRETDRRARRSRDGRRRVDSN
jgi:filamentous hemagglutinin family protein